MQKYMATKKDQVKVAAVPKPAPAVVKPVKAAIPAPVVAKKPAQPKDIRQSESFKSKVQDIEKTLEKHTPKKTSVKKSGFSLMKALGGNKKAKKVEAKPAAAVSTHALEKSSDHLEMNRDSIKATKQKEKEVVKEEDMAYSTDAITDYGSNLNNIHDKYQIKFSTDGKKDDKFGVNDIEVSTLDDEDAPAQKKIVAQMPAPAPKPAEPVAPPRPMKNVEDAVESTGSKLVASLVEPATTTVEAGGLRIEVSQLEDLD